MASLRRALRAGEPPRGRPRLQWRTPWPGRLSRRRARPGEHRLREPGMAVTLNGTQGYITDRVAELLRSAGLSDVLIDLGELRGLGRHPEDGHGRSGKGSARQRPPAAPAGAQRCGARDSAGAGTVWGEGAYHTSSTPGRRLLQPLSQRHREGGKRHGRTPFHRTVPPGAGAITGVLCLTGVEAYVTWQMAAGWRPDRPRPAAPSRRNRSRPQGTCGRRAAAFRGGLPALLPRRRGLPRWPCRSGC